MAYLVGDLPSMAARAANREERTPLTLASSNKNMELAKWAGVLLNLERGEALESDILVGRGG